MAAQVPYPEFSFQVCLDARPNSTDTPSWTNATELVLGASGLSRGHPYAVPTVVAASPTVSLRDVNELFNPGNPASPFVHGVGNRFILPYRGAVWQAMFPRGGTGNLWNTGFWRVPVDPTFESYTTGTTPAFVTDWRGISAPTVSTSAAFQGSKSLQWSATGGAGLQATGFQWYAIPGRYYRVSVYVLQGAANTLSIWVDGQGADVASTTAVSGSVFTRLSGVVYADQPQMTLLVGYRAPGLSSSVNVDAIMVEPVTPLNGVLNFNRTTGGYTGGNGAQVQQRVDIAGRNLGSLRVIPNGVTAAPQGQSPFFPVSPSTAYALHGEVHSANSVTRQVTVWWYDSGQALISSVSNNIVIPTGWATSNPPLPVTSPVNAAFAKVGTSATGTPVASDFWELDHADLVAATPAAFTASGPVVYPVNRGFVERWPRQYGSQGFEGFANLQLTDVTAALASIKLRNEYVQTVLSKAPAYYWRLNEPAGSTSFADSSGNGGPPLTPLDGKYGGAETANSGAPIDIAGNPGATGWETNTTDVGFINLPTTVLQTGMNGTPPISVGASAAPYGFTVAAWIFHDASLPSDSGRIFLLMSDQAARWNNLFGNWQTMWVIAGSGPMQLNLSSAHVGSGNFADNYANGVPHLFVMTVSVTVSNATATAYVDGGVVATNTSAAGAGTDIPATLLQVGGAINPAAQTTTGGLENGVYSDLAIWNRALSAGDVTDLWNAGKGYPGELAGTRLARHLVNAGYLAGTPSVPASRISSGRSALQPTSRPDLTPMLTDAQRLALEELGTLWIAPDGALVFESRDDRFLRTVPFIVFGEDFANGECPYGSGITFNYDPLYLYANVQITQTNGIIATGGLTADIAAAEANYFGRTYAPSDSLDIQDAEVVQDYANWTFYGHNTPDQRIDSVEIDPMANPGLWPYVLNAEIGRRVTVNRRPQGLAGGVVYSEPYFIEQVVHTNINFDTSSGQPPSWKTQLFLTPASTWLQPWLLDDATWSVLGSTTRLGV